MKDTVSVLALPEQPVGSPKSCQLVDTTQLALPTQRAAAML